METEMPLIDETIALTEKKVDMALDDIIKLSKRKTNVKKGKKLWREKNEYQNFNGATRNSTSKARHRLNSLSAIRQGAVAKRSSQGTQFLGTTNIRKAAAPPPLSVRGRAFNGGNMSGANQSRRIAPPVQNISVHAKVNTKRHGVYQKVGHRGVKRKTLDSRFASMKEQRKTINTYGVMVQGPRLPPWARARRFPH